MRAKAYFTNYSLGYLSNMGYALAMEPAREALARHVLKILGNGQHVPEHDALQLRNWASRPEDAMLPLEEIACRILSHREPNAKAAEQ